MARTLIRLVQTLRTDVLYSLRGLRNAPGYAVPLVLTLALGLGVTTAMLAVVDSVLLEPLPMPHAERVDSLMPTREHGEENQEYVSWARFQALREGLHSFSAMAAFSSLPEPVETGAGSRVLPVVHATPSLFAVAGVPALLGRTLGPGDERAPVAVLGNELWRSDFAADPGVLGRQIRVNGLNATVVGVMPAEFRLNQNWQASSLYMPLIVDASGKDTHGFDGYPILSRRRAGVSRAAAAAEVSSLLAHLPAEPDRVPLHLQLRPYAGTITGEQQPALLALLGACLLLLAIACVNAANLQVARGTARAGEMAVRAALGATRGRLLRQIVTESMTVSLLGAGFGLPLAQGVVEAARHLYGKDYARFDELALRPPVFAAAALLAVLVGVLAALLPVAGVLGRGEGGARPAARSTRRSRVGSVLVVTEVALTCLLLVATGLFLRTFRALEQVPLGFDPAGATTVVLMPEDPKQAVAAQQALYAQLLDRLNHLPGVSSAAFSSSVPFSSFQMTVGSGFRLAGDAAQQPGGHGPKNRETQTDLSVVSPEIFRAMGIPLRAGRLLNSDDIASAMTVAVVNQEFVRRFAPAGLPLGRQIVFPPDLWPAGQPVTIVGVVGDTLTGRDLTRPRKPLLYLTVAQVPPRMEMAHFLLGVAPQFVVRSELAPDALAAELRPVLAAFAPGFAIMRIESMGAGMESSLRSRRLALRLASGFGLAALVLAGSGIYGLLSYTVVQRRREIGIRMALGSTRGRTVRLVLGESAVLAGVGLVLGFAAVWPATRSIGAMLYGVKPLDTVTLLTVAAVLALCCLLAAVLPARRASRVDPMLALRAE